MNCVSATITAIVCMFRNPNYKCMYANFESEIAVAAATDTASKWNEVNHVKQVSLGVSLFFIFSTYIPDILAPSICLVIWSFRSTFMQSMYLSVFNKHW